MTHVRIDFLGSLHPAHHVSVSWMRPVRKRTGRVTTWPTRGVRLLVVRSCVCHSSYVPWDAAASFKEVVVVDATRCHRLVLQNGVVGRFVVCHTGCTRLGSVPALRPVDSGACRRTGETVPLRRCRFRFIPCVFEYKVERLSATAFSSKCG